MRVKEGIQIQIKTTYIYIYIYIYILYIYDYVSLYVYVYIHNIYEEREREKDIYIYIYISSFRLPHKKSTTTLSEHVWNLKNNNIEHCISWEIIENSHPYNTASKKCNLCTAEKYFILTGKPTLNKRREIFAQCPHRRKYLLQNIRDSSIARQSPQRP